MAVALVDLSRRAGVSVPVPIRVIRILIAHGCPLFRVGLRSFLAQQDDCCLVGEATHPEDVLVLAREQHPDVVLLDSNLTSADPLDLVQQLRQAGVPGIMVFASPAGNEETLFHFLKYGATAYEDPFLSGEELLEKLHRVAQGECLVTGDVLIALAARRKRLARLRRDALLAMGLAEACLPSPLVGDRQQEGNGQVSEDASVLSAKERAILEQIARGGTNAQVAQALGIGPHIVKDRLNTLYQKLHVHDRTSAVVMALRARWIALDSIPLLSL
jgi:DNA-binding NarL/FixJ family response regulator